MTLLQDLRDLRDIVEKLPDVEDGIESLKTKQDPHSKIGKENLEELAKAKKDIATVKKLLQKKYVWSKISVYFITLVALVLIFFEPFLLLHFLHAAHLHGLVAHLYGFGTTQFKKFDWGSLIINLVYTIGMTAIVLETMYVVSILVDTWISNDKLASLLKNLGKLFSSFCLIGSVVISFVLSMNSNQLSIVTSTIALFAVFGFAFRGTLQDISNLLFDVANRTKNKPVKNGTSNDRKIRNHKSTD